MELGEKLRGAQQRKFLKGRLFLSNGIFPCKTQLLKLVRIFNFNIQGFSLEKHRLLYKDRI
jgi:hypothetical protein